jgi:hypothetical protein
VLEEGDALVLEEGVGAVVEDGDEVLPVGLALRRAIRTMPSKDLSWIYK